MMIILWVPIPPVMRFRVVWPKMIIVSPDPTSTRTVIGNRANQRVLVVLDGLPWMVGITVRKSTTVAHPVQSFNK